MKYSIRLNDTTNGNIVFEGYFVVNASNLVVEMYETINGITSTNNILLTDGILTSDINYAGYPIYLFTETQITYVYDNAYSNLWKQFSYYGIMCTSISRYPQFTLFNLYSSDQGSETISNIGYLENGDIKMSVSYTITPDSVPSQPRPRMTMGSLYTNNAQVYYKSHTLAPGGIGGVRNYRLKSRKT